MHNLTAQKNTTAALETAGERLVPTVHLQRVRVSA